MQLDDDTRADVACLVKNITIALQEGVNDDTMPVREALRLLRWRQRLRQLLNQ